MHGAFSFPEISGRRSAYVNGMRHKAFIDVTAEGVEAAAVTKGDLVLSEPPPSPDPDVTLRLDRPFLFLIRGNITGTLLFIGAVYNPDVS